MDAGIGVDEDALGGESLGAVAGDCIAVIKVAVLGGVEFNLPVIFELGGDTAIERNGVCRWTSQRVPSWPASVPRKPAASGPATRILCLATRAVPP